MAKVINSVGDFFVHDVWETFCKKWIWQTFCVAWFWEAFCVNILYKKFDKYKAWIYLSPALVLLAIFTVWPIFNTLRMAFWDGYGLQSELGAVNRINELLSNKEAYDLLVSKHGEAAVLKLINTNPYPFQFGIQNFVDVITTSEVRAPFALCLWNTILLCFLTVPLSTIIALLIAVCLNSIKPLNRLLQTIYFLPYVTNSIAIGMVFNAMFNIVGLGTAQESVGIVNNVLNFFGIDAVNWINTMSPYWANITVLTIYIVWNALPFKILILLGGLQSVNKQYYDAAKIDSTPKARVFTKITVPLLSPMIAYVVITGFIGGFKEYSSIVGIFGEDMMAPSSTSLNTMVGYIYDALGTNREGEASAAALILFGIIFIVTMINLSVSKKKTHY